MIGILLNFRLRQFARMLKAIGAIYLVALVLVCGGFLLGIVDGLLQSETSLIGLVGVAIVSSVHFSRKDGGFLKKLCVNRYVLYSLEYFLSTLLLSFLFLYSGNIKALALQFVGVLIVAVLPNPEVVGSSFTNKLDFKFLPTSVFEAKSYLRRYVIPISLVYGAGLITIKYLTIPIVIVLLIAMFFTAFFDEVESTALFEASHFKKGILNQKVQSYLGLYLTFLLPYIVLFLVFHTAYWYLLLAAIFVGMTLILFNIFYKYAHYTPYRRRIYNSMANSMFIVFAIVPFTFPVTLLYVIYYWRKARKNIKNFYA